MKATGTSAKAPKAIFKKCPTCGCTELLPVGADVLCGTCDWSSMQSHVDSGGMDNIFSAYIDHFMADDEAVQIPAVREKVIKELETKYLDPADFIIDETEQASA